MFERNSAVIRDGSKLSFDYVPKKLVHREEQMKALEMLFRPMVTEGRACTAFLSGGVGTGKTVTAKRFCDDMSAYCQSNGKLMDMEFINCRIKNTEYGVFLQLVRHFDSGYPERGFSVAEMLRMFRANVEKNGKPMVLVFDEVDMLLKSNGRDIVYQMARMNDELKRSSISLILISQISVAELLDEASVSTFKRANTVRFERYSRNELEEIIMIRAEEALVDGALCAEEVTLLSEIASQYGDARFAIELIERSASIAESGNEGRVTADDIRTANAMIYSDVSERKLRELDLNKKLVLLAVSRAIKKEAFVDINAVEKTYAIVCEEYECVAKKHTQFWKYLQNLEQSGLINTEIRNGMDNGRLTFISVPNIPPKELAKKLEYLLEIVQNSDGEVW